MITIHSDIYAEITYAGGTLALEYDQAADLVEAIRAEPDREAEFEAIAIREYERTLEQSQ